jgi:hypothetical protein
MTGIEALNVTNRSIVSRLLTASKACLLYARLSSVCESMCRSSLLNLVEHPVTGHSSCLILTCPDCQWQRSTLSSVFLTLCASNVSIVVGVLDLFQCGPGPLGVGPMWAKWTIRYRLVILIPLSFSRAVVLAELCDAIRAGLMQGPVNSMDTPTHSFFFNCTIFYNV